MVKTRGKGEITGRNESTLLREANLLSSTINYVSTEAIYNKGHPLSRVFERVRPLVSSLPVLVVAFIVDVDIRN